MAGDLTERCFTCKAPPTAQGALWGYRQGSNLHLLPGAALCQLSYDTMLPARIALGAPEERMEHRRSACLRDGAYQEQEVMALFTMGEPPCGGTGWT